MGDISDAGYFLSVLHILCGHPIHNYLSSTTLTCLHGTSNPNLQPTLPNQADKPEGNQSWVNLKSGPLITYLHIISEFY